MSARPLIICSKSAWSPSIRREHAVAASAAAAGHEVVFVERALDARALFARASRRAWLTRLRALPRPAAPQLHVLGQATLVPGHRSALAQRLDALRLQRTLRHLAEAPRAVVVATQPWQWPAVAAAPAMRRVFDCADDWARLIPGRAGPVEALLRRIAAEADTVIVAAPELVPAFAGAAVIVVRNGAARELLDAPVRPLPDALRMVYAGTLSERFDATFLLAALDRLDGWSVELYGQCQYAGAGDAPGPELRAALAASGGRMRLSGPVERTALAAVLDRARVLIAPHRAPLTSGQDSMKLYDYASRERPIVATPGALGPREHVAGAGVTEAGTAVEFALAVAQAADGEAGRRASRRQWLADNGWDARWPAWAAAAFGGRVGAGDAR